MLCSAADRAAIHWLKAAIVVCTALVAQTVLAERPDAHGARAVDETTKGTKTTTNVVEVRALPSARAALRLVLRDKPAVIGIGEYHQTEGDAKVSSALQRFTRRLLPFLQRRVSDLVLETWVTEGNCGAEEKRVVDDVAQTTERPASTEDELVTLIKRARRYRIRPHILTLSCKNYRELLGGDGVDYNRLLELTGQQLREKIVGITKIRLDPIKRAVDDSLQATWGGARGGKRDMIVVYGGAVHNDLHPDKATASYSYAPVVAEAASGRYVEVDLVVPEFLQGDSPLLKGQPWFEAFKRNQSRRHALLIRRAKNAYVIVFRRSS